jgi:CRISPR type IV-associated protein Csf1
MHSYNNVVELAVDVGKIPLPTAVASDRDERCALTGTVVPAGTAYLVPWKAGSPFRDQYDIVERRSGFITQATAAIMPKPFMQKYSKSVICRDGWYGFSSTEDVAWFLLHPPEPPFAMFFGIAQMEHMIWRTPLSLSRDLFFVRLGQRNLRVNRPRVLDVVERSGACVAAVNDWLEGEGRKPIKQPFMSIARELNSVGSGQITGSVRDAADAGIEEAKAFVERFSELSSGDLWALGRINAARDKVLIKPKPLTIEVKKPRRRKP